MSKTEARKICTNYGAEENDVDRAEAVLSSYDELADTTPVDRYRPSFSDIAELADYD